MKNQIPPEENSEKMFHIVFMFCPDDKARALMDYQTLEQINEKLSGYVWVMRIHGAIFNERPIISDETPIEIAQLLLWIDADDEKTIESLNQCAVVDHLSRLETIPGWAVRTRCADDGSRKEDIYTFVVRGGVLVCKELHEMHLSMKAANKALLEELEVISRDLPNL